LHSPEYRITTVRAVIAFLFLLHPSLSSKLPPGWYSPQYHLFANGQGEVLNELARKIIALMTPFDTLINCTSPDRTAPTVHKQFIRETALALDLVYRYAVNTG
jgi:hypothetical protein